MTVLDAFGTVKFGLLPFILPTMSFIYLFTPTSFSIIELDGVDAQTPT
jgi:hypothetical protein